jgi:hypothetical protein
VKGVGMKSELFHNDQEVSEVAPALRCLASILADCSRIAIFAGLLSVVVNSAPCQAETVLKA